MDLKARQIRTLTSEAVSLLLAVVLILRVVTTPLIMTAPEPGQIAFCLNGQIVYASWDGDTPGEAVPHSDPCPYFGVTAVVEASDLAPVAPWRALDLQDRPEPAILLSDRPATVVYLSRAPPRAV